MAALPIAPTPPDDYTAPDRVRHGVPAVPIPEGLVPVTILLPAGSEWVRPSLTVEYASFLVGNASGEIVLRIPVGFGVPREPKLTSSREQTRPRKKR